MQSNEKRGWLLPLSAVLLMSVCCGLPLVVAGGAVFLSAVGGFFTRSLWLVLGILVAGALLASGVYLRQRRHRANACCLPDADLSSSQRFSAAQSDVSGPAHEHQAPLDMQRRK
jgi:hypothetical protein